MWVGGGSVDVDVEVEEGRLVVEICEGKRWLGDVGSLRIVK